MIRKRKRQGMYGYGGGLYPYYQFGSGQTDDDLTGQPSMIADNLGEQFDGADGGDGGGDGGGGGE